MYDWRGKDADELERHFNPRVAVPEALDLLAAYQQRAAAARETIDGEYDIRFGPAPKQTFDLYRAPAAGDRRPIVVFIHGGYWRLLDKADHSFVVPPLLDAGATVVNMNYDLCPDVTLDDIVAQVREGLVYVHANAADLGGDAGDIHLYGHSAGAHLAAMLLADDWLEGALPGGSVRSAALVSGIYEPAVVQRISVNADVRLTDEIAANNDCLIHLPAPSVRILAAAGGNEPEGWIAQTEAYAAGARAAGAQVQQIIAPGTNHFTVLDSACDPKAPLGRAVLQQIAATAP
jgi:arylformamidase